MQWSFAICDQLAAVTALGGPLRRGAGPTESNEKKQG
jgi:hypothetical protein